ncbi:hypothetical protein L6164_001155 [Bauhinia variegata]|uniref:Uncharacterized protein n=1 Tax=Bauhinia variegata TaxID=167791 RepID=A0ACB9QA21_BAUVA|nr:hypothetical protein L6164_001155 [Bauhinia variegata]
MGLFWVVIVFLCLCFNTQFVNSQNLTCNSNDMGALREFMNGLEAQIDGWDFNSSSDCCKWTGITCNSSRVFQLELGKRRLRGRISESIGSLDQLRTLNLSHNFLKGSLPVSLFHLPHLQVLDLSSNDITGFLPGTFNLPSILFLNISQNYLNGSLPSGICKNFTGIQSLNLAVNYFSGDIPQEIGDCSSLEYLYLGMNDLTGVIPEGIFRLRRLSVLSLQDNKLSGSLSEGISDLTDLVRFDISSNMFGGNIPDVFHELQKLLYFIVHSNNFTGVIPLSLSNSMNLLLLNLRNNSLHGSIDLNCSAMTSLTSLDLGSNQFSGRIPEYLPSCPLLKNINLSKNKFSGQIPESFKHFKSLSYFSISNVSLSNISSALEILQQCRNLTTLVLTLNFHGENLPDDASLLFENLKVLIIASCQLNGEIPSWLKGSPKLQLLDLSWNNLSGTVPPWFGKFECLFYLDLSNNSLTGEIPRNLTGLQSLINRTIALEEPSPDFPFFLKSNASERGLQYNQIWSFPPKLDLSFNNFSGPIWPDFGNLRKLHVLDLKFNHLSGQIPDALSGMASLETLDLSYNNLSGEIPVSLEKLSFLSMFNVAYNKLEGLIPSRGQFLTFPNSSFEGNNLCGVHASPCQSTDHAPSGAMHRSRTNTGTIIGMCIGIVFGMAALLVLVFVLLRMHSPREVDPQKDGAETDDENVEELGPRLVVFFKNKEKNNEFCIDDLLKSTNNFDQANIIGCGGFGLVYKAILPDGRTVAIKRLTGDSGQMDREFQAEVETLSRAQHPNLVLLQGYCLHKDDRLLIYSYMENSSLDYWLHEKPDGPASLDWQTRLRIAQGAARGLAYLHQSCEPHILHRDIKSSNILLDENFEAHLADFGLARLILPYDTHVTTDLVGTLGYIPPEYGQASMATYKGDVYSFGVVLLEILTGKRPMDMCKPKGSRDLISWVFEMKKENRVSEVFDPFIYDKECDKEISRLLEISCLCLSENPKLRPSTQQLIYWLDSIHAYT